MIRRYMRGGTLPPSPIRVYFLSNILTASDAESVTYATEIQGALSGSVQITVTLLNKSNVNGYFEINGSRYIQGDVIPFSLNGAGQVSFTQYANVGTSTTGNGISVTLTITYTSSGTISSPATATVSKTV